MRNDKNWFCLIEEGEVGPVSPQQIKKLIAAGTLSLADKIRKEDGEWREISKFPKLKELAKASPANSNESLEDDASGVSTKKYVVCVSIFIAALLATGMILSGFGVLSPSAVYHLINAISTVGLFAVCISYDKGFVYVFNLIRGRKATNEFESDVELPDWMPMGFVYYAILARITGFVLMSLLAVMFLYFEYMEVNIGATGHKLGFIDLILAVAFLSLFIYQTDIVTNRFLSGDRTTFLSMTLVIGIFGCIFVFSFLIVILTSEIRIADIPGMLVLIISLLAITCPYAYFAKQHWNDFA